MPEILELFASFSGFPERQKKDLFAGLSNYLNKARGISFELLKKVEEKAIKEGILKKGGYMNFTEEIKKEAKTGRLAERPKGRHTERYTERATGRHTKSRVKYASGKSRYFLCFQSNRAV